MIKKVDFRSHTLFQSAPVFFLSIYVIIKWINDYREESIYMNEIFARRSIRKFLPTMVEDEKIEQLLRAAMAAPSAGNPPPWEF